MPTAQCLVKSQVSNTTCRGVSLLFKPFAVCLNCGCSRTSEYASEALGLLKKTLFFAKSTFFHAGQRENISFIHAEMTFFNVGITFFSRWRVQREKM
jgi:hypothetical protein